MSAPSSSSAINKNNQAAIVQPRSLYAKSLFAIPEDAAAGAFAGFIGRSLTAPFDVIKIRYQLLCKNVVQTPSMFHAFRNIIKEEGALALWKGNLAATYLWISYAVVQFGLYGMMKNWADRLEKPSLQYNPDEKNKLKKSFGLANKAFLMFIAGATAGTAATVATYPFDIMRTQFAVQGKEKAFNSMSAYISHTYKTYGVRGFYSGIGPAIIGVTPYVGLNFAFYETLKTVAQKFHDSDNATVTVVKKGILGGIAGGSSKFIMYPLDTVKKRLQAQTLQSTISDLFEGPRYNGMKDCFAKIYHDEGIKGFYRGIVPTMAKAVSASAITFMAYEGAKEIIKHQKNIILEEENDQKHF